MTIFRHIQKLNSATDPFPDFKICPAGTKIVYLRFAPLVPKYLTGTREDDNLVETIDISVITET